MPSSVTSGALVGRRKDGSAFPAELAVGEVHGRRLRTCFLRDLSEWQAAEARLQDLQAELLHVSRLSAAGEMASALAHELNQPLTAITERDPRCATSVRFPAPRGGREIDKN